MHLREMCFSHNIHHKRVSVAVAIISRVTHMNIMKPNNLSKCISEPLDHRRVLPEKLRSSQIVKKFLAFYGTLSFITAFTTGLLPPTPHPPHGKSLPLVMLNTPGCIA